MFGIVQNWKMRRIAKSVRNGVVPKGVDFDTVCEALKLTKPKSPLEAFGFLFAKHYDPNRNLIKDYGLVGCKSVTLEFAEFLVDAMINSSDAAILDHFRAHAQGSDSTAESTADQALGSEEDGRNLGTQTHGASSNIYKSVATITATSTYGVREHGIFDSTGAGDDRLLDRTLVTNIAVNTDDEIEWTYQLTIATGG